MAAKFYTYRDVVKGGYSVKHKGKVVMRGKLLFIPNAHFQISEAGRQRVISEQCKNVHAYVVSEEPPVADAEFISSTLWGYDEVADTVSYNPYKGPHLRDSFGKPITDTAGDYLLGPTRMMRWNRGT